jgi:hypothetical protein
VDSSAERPRAIGRAATRGAAAGLLGVAVMTAAEKLEQSVTHRPDSYVPGRTLMTLLGAHPGDRYGDRWFSRSPRGGLRSACTELCVGDSPAVVPGGG